MAARTVWIRRLWNVLFRQGSKTQRAAPNSEHDARLGIAGEAFAASIGYRRERHVKGHHSRAGLHDL